LETWGDDSNCIAANIAWHEVVRGTPDQFVRSNFLRFPRACTDRLHVIDEQRELAMNLGLEQAAPSMARAPLPRETVDAINVLLAVYDKSSAEGLAAELSARGFAVQCTADPAALLASDDYGHFDVLVLEWNGRHETEMTLLAELQRSAPKLPIVFLAGETQTIHESLALDSGATDFVLRSRGPDVLAIRLTRAARRRVQRVEMAPSKTGCGKLRLDATTNRAYWNGQDVALTLGEYNIVQLLASAPGTFRTYRAIYDCLRGQGFIAGYGPKGYWANVRSAVKRIRGKFRDCDPTFDEITNYAGFGYCWNKAT
jgi:two-component system, OmpR family, response regulator ChvI